MPPQQNVFKIASLVEATTINAVAKNVLAFHRTLAELRATTNDVPDVRGLIVTFERVKEEAEAETPFVKAAREAGLEVAVIPERRRFDQSVILALRRIIADYEPDIIVSHAVKSHFLMWRSRLAQKYRWAAFHHGYTDTDRKMRLYNRLDRWSLRSAHGLITVCDAFARGMSRSMGVPLERIAVQHNSIVPAVPAAEADVKWLRERFEISPDEKIILAVGRLSKEKAHGDLLKAFKQMSMSAPAIRAKLVIVGDGPERDDLSKAAEDFGIASRVIFPGHTNNTQAFYSAADVFVLSSLSEGSSNVLLEAMAAGIPIVATSVGGVPEMVSDEESALLVPANQPTALAEAIARLLRDQDLAKRLAENALELVRTRFTPETYARAMMRIYQSVAT